MAQQQSVIPSHVDYGGRMITEPGARERAITELEEKVADNSGSAVRLLHPKRPGISIVIASYLGANRIGVCLESLLNQDLAPGTFEILVVINGPDDGTYRRVSGFRKYYPAHSIRTLYQSTPSAGAARNLGINAARYEFVTFVDDDDYVGTSFLANLLETASPKTVAVAPIINVNPDGTEDADNPLNAQIIARAGKPFALASASSILGFNACKLIPTEAAQACKYPEQLKSGEDICFMAEVATAFEFEAKVSGSTASSAYYRVLRDQSISRQELSFDFSVTQRLAVISELERNRSWTESPSESLLSSLIRSQASFVKRYVDEHPEHLIEVLDAVDTAGIKNFPWSIVNAGAARDLAVSYCFPPYSDTSAVVAAKAIVERGKIVDVVYNNMGSVRNKDSNLTTIASRLIDKSFEINAPASFGGWPQISEFVKEGIAVADRQDALIGGYRTIYSRVLWPGSHFLAARFKLRHPSVRWTAEFSDPVSRDAMGQKRIGALQKDEALAPLVRGVQSRGFRELATDNLFVWCEFVAYALADELVFTNENQLEYMLLDIADERLRAVVKQKAVIRVHPSPPQRSYYAVPSEYDLSPSVVNIGYFGAFYENRGILEVLTALSNTSPEAKRRIRLHVFTNKPDELSKLVLEMGLQGVLRVNRYVPYLEFLNLSKRLDVLLVNDVERSGEMPLNPFLPSKYSDYLGSGRPIWALTDEGSSLSKRATQYRSSVGNAIEAESVLREIVNARLEAWNKND